MSRNGSGTYALPLSAVTNGSTISHTWANTTLDDIAATLTASVATDGQSTMTGPLKAANGSAAAPAFTFGSDTNVGLYRIGADNVGMAINGALVQEWAAGITKVTDGAVGAPSVAFTSDPDSGLYRIGANNLGVAVNGAKVLDVATTGLTVTGTMGASGNIPLTGTDPASTVAFADTLTPMNIPKAWGRVSSNGAGGATVSAGFNIASVGINTTDIRVTLAQAMGSTNYAVCVASEGVYLPTYNIVSSTVIDIRLHELAAGPAWSTKDLAATGLTVSFYVFGAN